LIAEMQKSQQRQLPDPNFLKMILRKFEWIERNRKELAEAMQS
jgi:hypothetical protein